MKLKKRYNKLERKKNCQKNSPKILGIRNNLSSNNFQMHINRSQSSKHKDEMVLNLGLIINC